jgi:hypothetical protein
MLPCNPSPRAKGPRRSDRQLRRLLHQAHRGTPVDAAGFEDQQERARRLDHFRTHEASAVSPGANSGPESSASGRRALRAAVLASPLVRRQMVKRRPTVLTTFVVVGFWADRELGPRGVAVAAAHGLGPDRREQIDTLWQGNRRPAHSHSRPGQRHSSPCRPDAVRRRPDPKRCRGTRNRLGATAHAGRSRSRLRSRSWRCDHISRRQTAVTLRARPITMQTADVNRASAYFHREFDTCEPTELYVGGRPAGGRLPIRLRGSRACNVRPACMFTARLC